MKCRFLYNPKSGRGKIQRHLDYIVARLEKKYQNVDVYVSNSKEDLILAARNSCGIFDVLIFAGGDGTFNDVVNAIGLQPNRPVLGYLPCGTICDVAKNLKIPRKLKKALDIIVDGKIIEHDIGQINDKFFMYVTGLGDFTSIAYDTPHNKKKILGRIAYYFAAIRELRNFKYYYVKTVIDGKIIERKTPLFLVLNTKSVAGFSFNRHGHRNDGTFDIYIVKGEKPFTGLKNLITLIIFGHLRIKKERISEYFYASELTVTVDDDTSWCNDGERGPTGSAKIINHDKHISILVGQNYQE